MPLRLPIMVGQSSAYGLIAFDSYVVIALHSGGGL
jgi:hypothetical protein